MEWTWKLPPSLGGGDFVMRELTVAEVEQIQDRAFSGLGGDERKVAQAAKAVRKDLLMASIVSWKGAPVVEREAWYYKLRAKELAIVERGYHKIHTLTAEEEAYFNDSLEAPGKGAAA